MPPPAAPRVLLLFGSGGGGHKASASAVASVLRHHPPDRPPLSVDLVDAAALAGAAPGEWLYNILLSYNAVSAIDLMHAAIAALFPVAVPALRTTFRAFWHTTPDLAAVVSFVPMLNAVFADTLPPRIPLFTVLTDFSHTTSHPWIQHPRQHIVAGTDIALAQALAAGYLPPAVVGTSHSVTRSSGMVVHPRFYNAASPALRSRKRRDMRLHPALPTVLILFGGVPPTDRVVDLVDLFTARRHTAPVNIIAVCSRNKQLYNRLVRRKARNPRQHMFITAFSTEIPLLMQMSDVLIGKPGPGVVSEAYVSQLPCVLVTGATEDSVMKQEKDVLDWVRRAGIGTVVRTTAEAAKITVQQMAEMKERITSQEQNRAVFEVGELIFNSLGYQMPSQAQIAREMTDEEDSSPHLSRGTDIGTLDMAISRPPQPIDFRPRKRSSIYSADEDRGVQSLFFRGTELRRQEAL